MTLSLERKSIQGAFAPRTNRNGESRSVLPGSKSVACIERNAKRELGRPIRVPCEHEDAAWVAAWGKVCAATTGWESDSFVVLRGRESLPQGEGMDRHTKHSQETAAGTKRPERLLPTSLRAIASKARADSKHRFGGLYSLLNGSNLRAAYYELNPKAAAGVDEIDYAEYGKNLEAHVAELTAELKAKRYHAKLIRRVHIPKGPNATRPLGILSMSDKLVQRVAASILEAIFEQDFYDFSNAYRPNRGQRKAIRMLKSAFSRNYCGWVVEIDIKSFYDTLDHDWMMRMIEQRVSDRAFLRLIRKWLRAGIMEKDGKVIHPATGTAQGGIISCVLANIYLHYALDMWFEKKYKATCRGMAALHRFADDTIALFQLHGDAVRYMHEVEQRLRKFGLAIAQEKSGIKKFTRFEKLRSERFDFLGFEFRWGKTGSGADTVKLRTSRTKLRKSLRAFNEWMRTHRNRGRKRIFNAVGRKLEGYYNYYGVMNNTPSLHVVFGRVCGMMLRWLNRRSQRRSLTWESFKKLPEYTYCLPRPRVVWDIRETQLELALT